MSRLTGKGTRLLAILGTTLAATVGVTAVASAAPAGCASGYACFWEDHSYLTDGSPYNEVRFYMYYTDFNYLNYTTNKDAHDNVSSLYNNGNSQSIYVYKNENFGGQAFGLSKKVGDNDLSNSSGGAPGGFNDSIDSGCFTGWC